MLVKTKTIGSRGFTILELLVVISIMAIVATLATGAALKAVKQSRYKKLDATIKALEMALQTYRTQEDRWPFDVSDLKEDQYDKTIYWMHGKDNYKVFQKLYPNQSGNKTTYLDGSALFTQVKGSRMQLRVALNAKLFEAPIGYPHPENPNRFYYFCVQYNSRNDTVKVLRQDRDGREGNAAKDHQTWIGGPSDGYWKFWRCPDLK